MSGESLTLTPKHLADALRICIDDRIPVLVHGMLGIGKSEIVADTTAHMGLTLKDDRAILKDPVDLRGLPHVNSLNRSDWAVPNDFPDESSPPGVWFIDEINRAPVMVQNAYFQLVLNRRLGDYHLPPSWAIVAAGNYESDGGGVNRMPSGLSNRFVHFHLKADLDDWIEWAVTHSIDPMVIAFMRFKPNLLHSFDRNADAFPTPRSWTYVSNILSRKVPVPNYLELPMIAGAVGEGPASEFIAFLKLYRDLPDIDYIISHPDTAPIPQAIATLYAVASALASKANKDNLDNILKYLDRFPTEYAVFSIKDAVLRDPLIQTVNAFTKWAVTHSQLLK